MWRYVISPRIFIMDVIMYNMYIEITKENYLTLTFLWIE